MKWTEDDISMLAKLREQGLTYAKCAAVFGVNINSIAGACNRMKAKRKKLLEPGTSEPELYNPLLALKNNDCRWPIGDPRAADFKFCCETRKPGKSYCDAHFALSYVPVQPKKRILNPC